MGKWNAHLSAQTHICARFFSLLFFETKHSAIICNRAHYRTFHASSGPPFYASSSLTAIKFVVYSAWMFCTQCAHHCPTGKEAPATPLRLHAPGPGRFPKQTKWNFQVWASFNVEWLERGRRCSRACPTLIKCDLHPEFLLSHDPWRRLPMMWNRAYNPPFNWGLGWPRSGGGVGEPPINSELHSGEGDHSLNNRKLNWQGVGRF